MARLDRLGWAAGKAVLSHGVRIGIRATDAGALSRALEGLPPGWREAGSPVVAELFSLLAGGATHGGARRLSVAYHCSGLLARGRDLDPVLDALQAAIRICVAERAPRRVFVHAGVVGFRGRAILVPGASFSGKSTLVEALVRAGARYYSDEYAVLDRRGRVHPFRAPLALRGAVGEAARLVPPAELDPDGRTKPLAVALVALSRYRPGARWRPRTLSPGRGTLALLGHTVPARRDPRRSLATLRRVAARARVLQGSRGDADETARLLLADVAERG
ncbi:MAG TPA: hypothetical protein VFM88_06095 [Vicinamibacteria bacterium]|nr:hypothetical protein [Vicinamibacteria bacterium]